MPKKSTRPSLTGLYRPHLTSPKKRKFITVARQPVVDDTLEHLRGSATRRSKHHFLFIGPRGIGKSHLLSLIEDGIHADKKLKPSYHVVRFPEEANRLLSFADFLLGTVDILRDSLPNEPIWNELYEQLATEEDDDRIIDTLVPQLRRQNLKKKRTLLIMLENLNQLFTTKMRSKKSVAAMRKFFMDDNHCMLIATSPIYFDAITSVDEPFYDFFDTQIIEHLTEDETIALIKLNLEWDERDGLLEKFADLRPKLRAIYQMTAGNPRLTTMLYELIAHDAITEVRKQLDALLDRITPFYQDRLNDLPAQEQALLETLAMMRDTEKTPDAIAAKMRMKPQQVSTLLKRLSDALYIRSVQHPEDKRRRLYNIREGFFDIWMAMNVSRSARKRIPYLLDFFAAFYPSIEERNRKREELRQAFELKKDSNAETALGYLSDVGTSDEKAREKLILASQHAQHGNKDLATEYLTEARNIQLDPMGKWIVDHAETTTDYLGEIEHMIQCWQAHRSGDFEAFANKLLEIGTPLSFHSYSEIRLEFLLAQMDFLKLGESKTTLRIRVASILTDKARWQEAEHQLRSAMKETSQTSSLYSTILNNLAMLLKETNRLDEAEPILRQALDQTSSGMDHPGLAISLNNLASLLQDTNRLDEAEPMMRRALEIDQAYYGINHPKITGRLNNLALLLQITNRLDEAEPMMRQALDIDQASLGMNHPDVATDLGNLALLLKETNRLDEAEPMMRQALEIDQARFGLDHPRVAIRLNNLAQLLQITNRLDEAELMMRKALEIDQASFGIDHPKMARNLNNLAILLLETNRLDEAEPLMRRGLVILFTFTKKIKHPHPHLQSALVNYSVLLGDMNLSEAETNKHLNSISNEVGMSANQWKQLQASLEESLS